MRILVAGGGTGGHLYPGIAIARELVKLRPDAAPFFVGALRGIEREVLPGTEFPHALFDLHPLYRQQLWRNWRTLRGGARAWRQLGDLVKGERPAVVVGTGGYASGLALAYAAVHKLPYVLQEQNSYPGLTMRTFSRRAREIYLGFPEAARNLHAGSRTEIVDTGNPIEPPPAARPDRAAARRLWGFPEHGGRVLLVFGGSQGARALNEAVDAWIAAGRLPDDLFVLWGAGRGTYDQFRGRDSARVRVLPYISPMRDAYAATDLAIARAGAMSTAEMCAWGIPQILIPLPSAAADHQTVNAQTLERAGAAIHIPQAELTINRLDSTLRSVLRDSDKLAQLAAGASARGRPDAARVIAERILTLAGSQSPRS